MGIRQKTILSILIAVGISIGLFYQLAERTIKTRFNALEEHRARSRINYVLRLLNNSLDNLTLLSRDWGSWNDSYAFMNQRAPLFIESNLPPDTYMDTGLCYIGFFPLRGEPRWEGFYDHAKGTMAPPPPVLARTMQTLIVALRSQGPGSETPTGFFVCQGALHVMAATPILRSDESGPSRGWLTMVQRLSDTFFTGLFPDTGTKVSFATRPAPADSDAVHFAFTDNQSRYMCTGTLTDILGRETIDLTLAGKSTITLAGRNLLSLTEGAILFTGLMLSLLTYVLIQRTLLKRLLFLRHQVAPVAAPGTPVENVYPDGNDELSDLATDINEVFKRIVEEENLNRNILTALNVGILMIDAESEKIHEANTCMQQMTGKKREELVGQRADELFYLSTHGGHRPGGPHQEKGILKGPSTRHVLRTKTATRYHGTPIRIETFTDIQALESAVDDAKRSESHYRTLFKNSATPSVLFSINGHIAKLNREFLRYARAKSPRDLEGRHWSDFVDAEDRARLETYLSEKKGAGISFDDNVEVTFHDLSGGTHTAKIHIMRLPGTQERIVSILDITRQKKAEEMLRQQAFYDSLTGLANRRFFEKTLTHALDVARRKQRPVALFLIDLDGFKNVNDTMGHPSGDKLLTLVAKRLVKTMRTSDTVARLGGDEFIVLSEEIEDTQDIVAILHRLETAFVEPFDLGSTQLHITLSIGVSRFPDDAERAETLIRNADLAMYRAKKQGDTYSFFTHCLDRDARLHFELEQDLRKAVEKEEFSIYLQPRVAMTDHTLLGMEGLIRWCHPQKGICSPAEFIPCAELNGLIVPMDLWMMETGCRQVAQWNKEREAVHGKPPLRLALNVSAWHFRDNRLPDRVMDILKKTGCDPGWLELEVTETAIMKNLSGAIATLNLLRTRGISIALDDFGTGYSSLNYLRSIPVDTLKVDRSFIAAMVPEDEKSRFLLATIVKIGTHFNIHVVAEGVEEEWQRAYLESIGCPSAQGYLWSQPVPVPEFPYLRDTLPPPGAG
ncbi:EAL domain-containing protein [Desulfoluna spongiiphila]|uniref:EAL domain-containing protein n=1 Tax=Desulfoluna spongiiphila TaxID=419481 RepID=UPI0012582BE9|nr:EAL domain-containing protein [Desulfoluna spongiiphila]VVS90443.1 nucleotide cyclase [Desulfoluna spongiiphila]